MIGKRRAFTLAELIITIAVMGIVSIMIFNFFSSFMGRGRKLEERGKILQSLRRAFIEISIPLKEADYISKFEDTKDLTTLIFPVTRNGITKWYKITLIKNLDTSSNEIKAANLLLAKAKSKSDIDTAPTTKLLGFAESAKYPLRVVGLLSSINIGTTMYHTNIELLAPGYNPLDVVKGNFNNYKNFLYPNYATLENVSFVKFNFVISTGKKVEVYSFGCALRKKCK